MFSHSFYDDLESKIHVAMTPLKWTTIWVMKTVNSSAYCVLDICFDFSILSGIPTPSLMRKITKGLEQRLKLTQY